MQILDRYVLKELGPPFIVCAVLFTFFLIIDRIYQLTDLVVTKGVPFDAVGSLLVFTLPSFLTHTLPVALLVAVLLAAGRLAGDLELVALKASGVSPFRLFRPFVLAAVCVTGITAVLTLAVTPWANKAFHHHLFEILRTRVATGIKERVFNTTFDQLVIYVEELEASHAGLRGVLVADERNPKLSRIISAPRGQLLTDEEHGRLVLRFMDGALHESDAAEPTHYRYTTFGVYDMNLSIESLFSSAPRVRKPERNLSLRALVAATTPEGRGEDIARYEVELHKRLASPLAALVFTLVGFALATRSHRGGRPIALGGSLAIILSYYLLGTSLERIALVDGIGAWLAIWTPNVLFSALGLVLLWAPRAKVPHRWAEHLHSFGRRRADPRCLPEHPAGPPQAGDRLLGSWLIDRYLIREHLIYFGYGLAVGAVLILVGRLFHAVHHYVRTQPSPRAIVEHLAYLLPGELYRGLPVVTLVATIFLFASMARRHEVTALKAAGVSLYRMARPILLLGLAVSVASVAFQETLLPLLNAKAEEVAWVEIKGRPPRHSQRQTRLWYRGSSGDFVRIELLDPVGEVMDDVTVFQIDREFRIRKRLDAGQARWTLGRWEFREGIVRKFGAGNQVTAVPFRLTGLELPEAFEDFARIHRSPDEMSFLELRAYLNRLRESGHRVGKYLVELYAKLSFPLIHLIIPLVAIPFAIAVPGRGRIIGVALAILITAGYWFVHALAISFAQADLLPPLLGAWTANLVFAGLGVSLFLRTRT